MKPILEIRNIGKKYKIHHLTGGYMSLREWMMNALKFERNTTEDFWALKDIYFEVDAGESIGIVGRNGAGKSTLLKILSKITPPTSGSIVSRGRIASLLEVGTGFHPELTGRENIFFNGSLLGMKRREIEAKFDEIVDFSDVEKFLDTSLKHFSSGMQLRLAFAVAAFLEPEILIIDEVLAVGDAEFQKKCLGKMEDVSKTGRTILFVSHNIPTIKAICNKGIFLNEGKIISVGKIDDVVNRYASFHMVDDSINSSIYYYQTHIKIADLRVNDLINASITVDNAALKISFDIEFKMRTSFELDVHIKKDDFIVASFANFVSKEIEMFDAGVYHLEYFINLPALRSGKYLVDLYFTEPFVSWFAISENIINIDVINSVHHPFLNRPTLKWGANLMEGTVVKHRVS